MKSTPADLKVAIKDMLLNPYPGLLGEIDTVERLMELFTHRVATRASSGSYVTSVSSVKVAPGPGAHGDSAGAAPALSEGAGGSIGEAVDTEPTEFAPGPSDLNHKKLRNVMAKAGYGDDAAGIARTVLEPWCHTAGPWPLGERLGAAGRRAKLIHAQCPASCAGQVYNLTLWSVPEVLSFHTGNPDDRDTTAVVPGKEQFFQFRNCTMEGRTVSGNSAQSGTAILNSQVYHNAVLVLMYWLPGEDTSFKNWSTFPADRFAKVAFDEIVDGETPYMPVSLSVKAVNTTPKLYQGGSVLAGRRNAVLGTEYVRTKGQTINDVTDIPIVNPVRQQVDTYPPSQIDPSNSLNLQTIVDEASAGALMTVPLDYVELATNLGKFGTGNLAYFTETESWNASANAYDFLVTQGLQGFAKQTDWDLIPDLDTAYVKRRKISSTTIFCTFGGLPPESTFTISAHFNYIALPVSATDPVTAYSSLQTPLDLEMLERLTNAALAQKVWSPSSANGFGDFVRQGIKAIGDTFKPVLPVVQAGLSVASQMRGPVGRRAQMADELIKEVTGSRDGARTARREPSLARAIVGRESNPRDRPETRPVPTPRARRRGGGAVDVHKEDNGSLDIHVPASRQKR